MSKNIRIYKGKSGKQKGKWRGSVVAKNGNILIVTAEGYMRRRSVVNALNAAAKLIVAAKIG